MKTFKALQDRCREKGAKRGGQKEKEQPNLLGSRMLGRSRLIHNYFALFSSRRPSLHALKCFRTYAFIIGLQLDFI